MIKKYFFVFALIFISSCASNEQRECRLPTLSDENIRTIANAYLKTKNIDPVFRETAEKRISAAGCRYHYEVAEKLDSFGEGVIVVIDRNRKVIDFFGSN